MNTSACDMDSTESGVVTIVSSDSAPPREFVPKRFTSTSEPVRDRSAVPWAFRSTSEFAEQA